MAYRQVPVARLWVAVLCGYLALGATLQELPRYVSTRFHAGPFAVGVTVGLAFAGTAIARPLAGRAGDGGRSRRTVMTGGLLTAVAAAGHLLAPDLAALLAMRLLMGVGEGAMFSGALPWVLAGVRPDRAGRVAGWFGLSMWGGLSCGPLLAVAAAHVRGSTAVWLLVIALPLLSALLVITARNQQGGGPAPVRTGRTGRTERTGTRGRGWRDVLPRGAGSAGVLIGMASFGYGTLTALLVLFLARLPGGGQGFGLAGFSVAFLVTRAAGSPLVDRYGGLAVARIVLVVESAGLALLGAAHGTLTALLAVALAGVGLGLVYPAATKLTLGRAAAARAGAAVGAMTSFWDLGILVAGPVSGLVAAGPGFRAAFWIAAAMPLVALAVTGPRIRCLRGWKRSC